jgi:predicted PurR-regulated permease PerM
MDDRKIQLRWLALVIAAGVALYLCWLMLRPFLEVLAWAAVLVTFFFPVHLRLRKRLHSPGWAAFISTALVVLTILAPLAFITTAVVKELGDAARGLQGFTQTLFDPHSPLNGRVFGWLGGRIGRFVNVEELRNGHYLTEQLQQWSGALANRTLGFVGNVAGAVVKFFFVVYTMYYLFRDGDKLRRRLRNSLPLSRAQAREIINRTCEVLTASVYGVLVIASIQGTLGGLAFWALGLPSPLLWGVVMTLLSMIPLLGSFVVWVPAAAWLAATGHWGKAAALVAWGALVIGVADNFLRPKLVGGRTRLHELLIFFSVLGGLQVFGVLGLLLGPVVVAVTLALFDIIRRSAEEPQPQAVKPTLIKQQAEIRNAG